MQIPVYKGGMCHLDAGMTEQGLQELGTEDLDLVVLENVGNLVCPAEFETGAVKNAMILSVPEGHDKPLKYPLIFTVCDANILVATERDFEKSRRKQFVSRIATGDYDCIIHILRSCIHELTAVISLNTQRTLLI